MIQYWSWILTAVGVLGLYLAGRGSMWGWAVGLGAQGLWIGYALSTDQLGFLISATAYSWVYLKNFRSWNKKEDLEAIENPRIQKTSWSGEAMDSTVKVTIEWPADDEDCWDWFEKIKSQAQHPQRQGRIKVSEPALTQE